MGQPWSDIVVFAPQAYPAPRSHLAHGMGLWSHPIHRLSLPLKFIAAMSKPGVIAPLRSQVFWHDEVARPSAPPPTGQAESTAFSAGRNDGSGADQGRPPARCGGRQGSSPLTEKSTPSAEPLKVHAACRAIRADTLWSPRTGKPYGRSPAPRAAAEPPRFCPSRITEVLLTQLACSLANPGRGKEE